jgi:hypothetical protein
VKRYFHTAIILSYKLLISPEGKKIILSEVNKNKPQKNKLGLSSAVPIPALVPAFRYKSGTAPTPQGLTGLSTPIRQPFSSKTSINRQLSSVVHRPWSVVPQPSNKNIFSNTISSLY